MSKPNRPLFFLSAGEPSGDIHAAELVRELKKRFPTARFVAYGGPNMEKAGCEVRVMLTELAVMWLGRVLWNLRTFFRYLKEAGEFFRNEKPDAVILVDFPGFNWHIAKRAKAAGVPVYYFMPPQIWAWASWRIKKMQQNVDHVLCCLPFEEKWFGERGCQAYRIGHPFLEEVRAKELDQDFIQATLNSFSQAAINKEKTGIASLTTTQRSDRSSARMTCEHQQKAALLPATAADLSPSESLETEEKLKNPPILTILPGSRNQEVSANLAPMLSAAKRVMDRVPHVQPVIAAFKESQAETIRQTLLKRNLAFPVYVGRTPELMQMACCCLAVSGSVSMELLAWAKPTVIYYRLSHLAFWIQRFFRHAKYITLVNLLAVDECPGESLFYPKRPRCHPADLTEHERNLLMFPEYLTWQDRSAEVAEHLETWLNNAKVYELQRIRIQQLLDRVDQMGNPVHNAAQYIEESFSLEKRKEWS